jgi:hypothetical protein
MDFDFWTLFGPGLRFINPIIPIIILTRMLLSLILVFDS